MQCKNWKKIFKEELLVVQEKSSLVWQQVFCNGARQTWKLEISTLRLFYFFHGTTALSGPGLLIIQASHSHSVRRTTLGRTSLDEWSDQCRDLYLTTHSTHKRQTSMPLAGFEPTIPANERPYTLTLVTQRDWPKTVLWKTASWTAGDMMYY